MSDSAESQRWLEDFSVLESMLDELTRDVNERNKLSSMSQPVSKQNAQLRKTHSAIEQKISVLREKLELFSSNKKKYGVTEREVERRKSLVNQAEHRKENLGQMIRGGVGAAPTEKTELIGDRRSNNNGGRRGYDARMETDDTRAMENDHILNMQAQIMRNQDDQLGDLSKSLSRVKELSLEVNDELDLHKALLSDIENGTDKLDAKLAKQQKNLTHLTKKQMGCCIFVVLFLLIAILVTLALTHWGCDIVGGSRCKKNKNNN
eukprot:comp12904_c0_seq1/m.17313 comp12904_c0_seq1/g.17313  ORF comp12904_c0_seq1/g.17313 comp12904_c0_seq1/m.17313 type:complete len:263 (-) comp12904_c0_seq1:23-811(-)